MEIPDLNILRSKDFTDKIIRYYIFKYLFLNDEFQYFLF